MNDALIEAVARALHTKEWENVRTDRGFDDQETTKKYWTDSARAALAAIEQSGTHVVVPVEATE